MRISMAAAVLLLSAVPLSVASATSARAAPPLDADALSALRERAAGLMDEGRDAEALPLLDDIVRARPDDGMILNDRGLARWHTISTPGSAGGGFAALQARLCLEVEADCPALRLALADFDRAIALESGPERAIPYANRAEIRFARGDRRAALADEDESLRLRPASARTLRRRAEKRLASGDRAGALADLDASLAHESDAVTLAERAELRKAMGDADSARSDVDAALNRPDPPSVNPRLWHARLHGLRRALARPGEPGMEAALSLAVDHAALKPQPKGAPLIAVTITPESVARFAPFTREHVGSRIDVSLGGRSLMRSIILTPIAGDTIQVSGSMSDAETTAITAELKPGAQLSVRVLD